MFWYSHDQLGPAGWFFMTVFMIAFWSLFVWALVDLLRPANRFRVQSPERVLAGRFAAGELDTEDYHARLAVLMQAQARAGN